MCPPTYFDVRRTINPWMDPAVPVDTPLAVRQWSELVASYERHGHRVDVLAAQPGLDDMVFAANGATVVDGLVYGARFAHPERTAEAGAHAAWHHTNGILYGGTEVHAPAFVNEAEGDFSVLPSIILAGYGFRTTLQAHRELERLTRRRVLSLELVDPRFYHLDVALAVLDAERAHIAYYPPAFSAKSRARLERLFPDAIIGTAQDAYALGLNCVSDGRHVFVPAGAEHLTTQLAKSGYQTVRVDLSELAKGGGSVKCCTQEIRPARLDLLTPMSNQYDRRHSTEG